MLFCCNVVAFDPKEYQQALEVGEVNSAYVRVMFVGPGGVGKTSLLHRLMKRDLPIAKSTQLADTLTVKLDNIIKPAFTTWAVASGDPRSFWREVTDNDEIMELVAFVNVVAKNSKSTPNNFCMRDDTTTFRLLSDSSKFSNGQDKIVDIQEKVISEILIKVKENPDILPPEMEVLVRVWDCGGQSVFLDVLPAFITPRTMFLLMFDASRSLTDKCLIRSFCNGKVVDRQEHMFV